MSTISSYIFVHDQQIILDCDVSGKFKNLPDMHYVFLGMGQINKIISRPDVIIARDLLYNLEKYPKFCSFTGWYALWRNNLILSDYVHLLEYDITMKDNFNEVTENIISKNYEFIGYIPSLMNYGYISHPKYLGNIFSAIEKQYKVDIKNTIVSMYKSNKDIKWSSTSNSTFSLKTFNQYMKWFSVLIDSVKNDPMCGHIHERSISFFYIICRKKFILTKKLISHLMLNSHKS